MFQFEDVPGRSDWKRSQVIAGEDVATALDQPADPTRIRLLGSLPEDELLGERIYEIPSSTPIPVIVESFRVGSHGARSYGYEEEETVALVQAKASAIAERIPSKVISADSAGLRLKFLRPINEEDLEFLIRLFPDEEGFQSGAEGYIIEQEEGNQLFRRVKGEGAFAFWWD